MIIMINNTHGRRWEHTREPSHSTVRPDDRGLLKLADVVSTVDTATFAAALRSSLRRNDGQLQGVRLDCHVRYRVEGRTNRRSSGPDTEPRRFPTSRREPLRCHARCRLLPLPLLLRCWYSF